MLLAAGRGERMKPLTDTTAKPLLRVNGKRLIDYHLEKLAAAGITEIVINTSWQAEKIVDEIGDGSRYGLQIEYSHEPTALETAGGIRQALPQLGEHPFLVISADIWCDIDYADLTEHLDNNHAYIAESQQPALQLPDAHLLMVDNPAHNSEGDFAISANGKLQLKPDTSQNPVMQTCTYSGIGIYHPRLFKPLDAVRCPLREVLFPAIAAGDVSATMHDGKWFDVGTVERLQMLDRLLRA